LMRGDRDEVPGSSDPVEKWERKTIKSVERLNLTNATFLLKDRKKGRGNQPPPNHPHPQTHKDGLET